MTGARWLLDLAILILAWEAVRLVLSRAVAGAVRRRVTRALLDRRVRLDRYKFANRFYVRAEMLDDPAVQEAILAAARGHGSVDRARREVEAYIDEIVPAFSFVAYYQLGKRLARLATNLVYDVSADRPSMLRAAQAIGDGDVAVFVANHRSNADYVVLARVLLRQTAISYAVGEWARVWPLDALFRSFGAYFVRRGFRDPLYHAVLRRYVQLSARRGVTQGIFPEGRLTRDGRLGPAKVGVMGALAELVADPAFRGDVLLIPVGLNFDRVLEDAALAGEASGRAPGAADRLRGLVRFVWRFPIVVVSNAVRLLLGRARRHGVAAVAFGEPLSLRRLLGEDGRDAPDRDWARDRLGPRVMEAIGRAVPVTPVTLACLALSQEPGPTTRDALRDRMASLLARLGEAGAPIARVPRLRGPRLARAALDRAAPDRRPELVEVERDIVGVEEAEAWLDLSLPMLARRRLVRLAGDVVEPRPDRLPLLRYYASSIAHHLDAPPPRAT